MLLDQEQTQKKMSGGGGREVENVTIKFVNKVINFFKFSSCVGEGVTFQNY